MTKLIETITKVTVRILHQDTSGTTIALILTWRILNCPQLKNWKG